MYALTDDHQGTAKPTYEELANAFWTFLANANNDGAGVAPSDEDVERAYAVLERTQAPNPYPGFPAGF